MSDMNIKRTQGEYTAPQDIAARRYQTKPDMSFADLLKNVEQMANSSAGEKTYISQQTLPGEVSSGLYTRMREISDQWLTQNLAAESSTYAAENVAVVLEKLEGETDEAWQRRCITFETARRWQENSRMWRAECAGMDFADGIAYCDEKASEWLTGLMSSEPAMFREWLEQEKWHIEESGLDNAILPAGFTEEDMGRWMAKGVLEYL